MVQNLVNTLSLIQKDNISFSCTVSKFLTGHYRVFVQKFLPHIQINHFTFLFSTGGAAGLCGENGHPGDVYFEVNGVKAPPPRADAVNRLQSARPQDGQPGCGGAAGAGGKNKTGELIEEGRTTPGNFRISWHDDGAFRVASRLNAHISLRNSYTNNDCMCHQTGVSKISEPFSCGREKMSTGHNLGYYDYTPGFDYDSYDWYHPIRYIGFERFYRSERESSGRDGSRGKDAQQRAQKHNRKQAQAVHVNLATIARASAVELRGLGAVSSVAAARDATAVHTVNADQAIQRIANEQSEGNQELARLQGQVLHARNVVDGLTGELVGAQGAALMQRLQQEQLQAEVQAMQTNIAQLQLQAGRAADLDRRAQAAFDRDAQALGNRRQQQQQREVGTRLVTRSASLQDKGKVLDVLAADAKRFRPVTIYSTELLAHLHQHEAQFGLLQAMANVNRTDGRDCECTLHACGKLVELVTMLVCKRQLPTETSFVKLCNQITDAFDFAAITMQQRESVDGIIKNIDIFLQMMRSVSCVHGAIAECSECDDPAILLDDRTARSDAATGAQPTHSSMRPLRCVHGAIAECSKCDHLAILIDRGMAGSNLEDMVVADNLELYRAFLRFRKCAKERLYVIDSVKLMLTHFGTAVREAQHSSMSQLRLLKLLCRVPKSCPELRRHLRELWPLDSLPAAPSLSRPELRRQIKEMRVSFGDESNEVHLILIDLVFSRICALKDSTKRLGLLDDLKILVVETHPRELKVKLSGFDLGSAAADDDEGLTVAISSEQEQLSTVLAQQNKDEHNESAFSDFSTLDALLHQAFDLLSFYSRDTQHLYDCWVYVARMLGRGRQVVHDHELFSHGCHRFVAVGMPHAATVAQSSDRTLAGHSEQSSFSSVESQWVAVVSHALEQCKLLHLCELQDVKAKLSEEDYDHLIRISWRAHAQSGDLAECEGDWHKLRKLLRDSDLDLPDLAAQIVDNYATCAEKKCKELLVHLVETKVGRLRDSVGRPLLTDSHKDKIGEIAVRFIRRAAEFDDSTADRYDSVHTALEIAKRMEAPPPPLPSNVDVAAYVVQIGGTFRLMAKQLIIERTQMLTLSDIFTSADCSPRSVRNIQRRLSKLRDIATQSEAQGFIDELAKFLPELIDFLFDESTTTFDEKMQDIVITCLKRTMATLLSTKCASFLRQLQTSDDLNLAIVSRIGLFSAFKILQPAAHAALKSLEAMSERKEFSACALCDHLSQLLMDQRVLNSVCIKLKENVERAALSELETAVIVVRALMIPKSEVLLISDRIGQAQDSVREDRVTGVSSGGHNNIKLMPLFDMFIRLIRHPASGLSHFEQLQRIVAQSRSIDCSSFRKALQQDLQQLTRSHLRFRPAMLPPALTVHISEAFNELISRDEADNDLVAKKLIELVVAASNHLTALNAWICPQCSFYNVGVGGGVGSVVGESSSSASEVGCYGADGDYVCKMCGHRRPDEAHLERRLSEWEVLFASHVSKVLAYLDSQPSFATGNYCATIDTSLRTTAIRTVLLQPALRRGYSTSLEKWKERRAAEVRAVVANFSSKKSEVMRRAQAVADAMMVSVEGARKSRHLSVQITKLFLLIARAGFPTDWCREADVFLNRLLHKDSAVDAEAEGIAMLSTACDKVDDEVYRFVKKLYDLTLHADDWRRQSVGSDYAGIDLHISQISCQLAATEVTTTARAMGSTAWDAETMRRCADHLVMATRPTADDPIGLLELQTNAATISKNHIDSSIPVAAAAATALEQVIRFRRFENQLMEEDEYMNQQLSQTTSNFYANLQSCAQSMMDSIDTPTVDINVWMNDCYEKLLLSNSTKWDTFRDTRTEESPEGRAATDTLPLSVTDTSLNSLWLVARDLCAQESEPSTLAECSQWLTLTLDEVLHLAPEVRIKWVRTRVKPFSQLSALAESPLMILLTRKLPKQADNVMGLIVAVQLRVMQDFGDMSSILRCEFDDDSKEQLYLLQLWNLYLEQSGSVGSIESPGSARSTGEQESTSRESYLRVVHLFSETAPADWPRVLREELGNMQLCHLLKSLGFDQRLQRVQRTVGICLPSPRLTIALDALYSTSTHLFPTDTEVSFQMLPQWLEEKLSEGEDGGRRGTTAAIGDRAVEGANSGSMGVPTVLPRAGELHELLLPGAAVQILQSAIHEAKQTLTELDLLLQAMNICRILCNDDDAWLFFLRLLSLHVASTTETHHLAAVLGLLSSRSKVLDAASLLQDLPPDHHALERGAKYVDRPWRIDWVAVVAGNTLEETMCQRVIATPGSEGPLPTAAALQPLSAEEADCQIEQWLEKCDERRKTEMDQVKAALNAFLMRLTSQSVVVRREVLLSLASRVVGTHSFQWSEMCQCLTLLNQPTILRQLSVELMDENRLRQLTFQNIDTAECDYADDDKASRIILPVFRDGTWAHLHRSLRVMWIADRLKLPLVEQTTTQRQLISRIVVLESSVGCIYVDAVLHELSERLQGTSGSSERPVGGGYPSPKAATSEASSGRDRPVGGEGSGSSADSQRIDQNRGEYRKLLSYFLVALELVCERHVAIGQSFLTDLLRSQEPSQWERLLREEIHRWLSSPRSLADLVKEMANDPIHADFEHMGLIRAAQNISTCIDEGSHVESDHCIRGDWRPAIITCARGDGKFDISCDDGKYEARGVLRSQLRLPSTDPAIITHLRDGVLRYFEEHRLSTWTEDEVRAWAVDVIDRAVPSSYVWLYEALAVLRRAAFLFTEKAAQQLGEGTGYYLRDTQLLVLWLLADPTMASKGRLVQMLTGEGKSITTAVFAALQTLCGKSVDVVTSSVVLARRDAIANAPFFEILNLSSACNCTEKCEGDEDERKKAYWDNNRPLKKGRPGKTDIVYGDLSSFERDYVLTTFYGWDSARNIIHESRLPKYGANMTDHCVIVDEVDSMLLVSVCFKLLQIILFCACELSSKTLNL